MWCRKYWEHSWSDFHCTGSSATRFGLLVTMILEPDEEPCCQTNHWWVPRKPGSYLGSSFSSRRWCLCRGRQFFFPIPSSLGVFLIPSLGLSHVTKSKYGWRCISAVTQGLHLQRSRWGEEEKRPSKSKWWLSLVKEEANTPSALPSAGRNMSPSAGELIIRVGSKCVASLSVSCRHVLTGREQMISLGLQSVMLSCGLAGALTGIDAEKR